VSPLVRPERRRPRTAWIALAAAAGVVVGGAGATLVPRWLDAGPDEAEVLAEAQLDPLPGWEATGQAVVEVAADGSRELVLTVDEQDGEDGYREVWLIDREVTRLVSLGVLRGSEGRFTVPDGLDLDDFAVVDVSEEPFDGDPAHSGDSVVRGILGA
ncbi:anti-sigma factor, partial [Actinotalea ferrariae]|uniref:anti-sigma factor n=1 Tax=Actinotalea ferrariae TaxID=1386098 RepID=UPI001C8CE140